MNVLQQTLFDPLRLAPIAMFLTVFALVNSLSGRPSPVSLRLARHRMSGANPAPDPSSDAGRRLSWRPRLPHPAVLTRIAARFNSEKNTVLTRALLNRAGMPMTMGAFARKKHLFTFVLAPLFALLTIIALGPNPLGFAAVALVLLTMPRLPAIQLKRTAKKRAKEMDAVISDVLDLLVVCVEGGQSLASAVLQLSTRMDNVAAEEFRRLLADLNSGISRRDAFTALADRCQSEALGIACTTIIHADKVGMSLAHTLRTLSDMMRTRRRQAAETRARQAPIKMMPVLVGFMLPAMLALLLGPVALEVMATFK